MLDAHCEQILNEYRERKDAFERMKDCVLSTLRDLLRENGITVTAVEGRVKTEKSLAGKLELKGYKYKTLRDITDIIGCRVITFYTNEVDKIAALVEQVFDVDWNESVDKRKLYDTDRFGYMSLHYICRVPKALYSDPACPDINDYRFEIQMRTTLQHIWAVTTHDTGYKSDIEIPREYLRQLSRLAGLLEIADEQFTQIITEVEEYRRQVRTLIRDGKYEDLELNGDTFRNYMEIDPFRGLNSRIAAVNRAEISAADPSNYLEVFRREFGFETIADVEAMRKAYEEDAYRLAVRQIAGTDLDILSANVGLQNLCVVKILKEGRGVDSIRRLLDILYGPRERNVRSASRIYSQAIELNIASRPKEE